MPATLDRIPRSAFDADKACTRDVVRLDRNTRLVRGAGQRVILQYRPGRRRNFMTGQWIEYEHLTIVTYLRDGAVYIHPDRLGTYDFAGLRRIERALPDDWTMQFRGRRLRPRLLFRDVLVQNMNGIRFLPNGDIQHGSSSEARISWASLNAEADEVEGVTRMRSRRRTPRALPEYATRVHADLAPMEAAREYVFSDTRFPALSQIIREWSANQPFVVLPLDLEA